MKQPLEINVDNKQLLNEFISFMQPEDNIDIILSAPFGAGKTYFLKNDFYESTKDKFNVFHLFPVNYSVSSNEDILELIKFDLLQECLIKHYNVIENDESLGFSSALQLSFFLNEKFNMIDFTNGVVEKVSNLIATDEMDVANHSLTLINFLSKEWNKIKTKSKVRNEQTIIDDFFKSFPKNKGIYENDDFTKFIKSFLLKLKTIDEDMSKKNILIIDDFDRIDPEHIFRLFNVFSAQKNYNTKVDKFGFDKVIFVCDINNIRKIYHHKYGVDVDFWGYVSKFVSTRVFHFNSKDQVIKNISNVLINAKYNDNLDPSFVFNNINYSTHIHILSGILNLLVKLEKVSLRDILKISDMVISSELFNSKKYKIDKMVLFIDKAIGGTGKFKEILKSLSSNGTKYNYSNLDLTERSAETLYQKIIEMILDDDSDITTKLIGEKLTIVKIQIKYNVHIEKTDGRKVFRLLNFEKGDYESFNIINYLNEKVN